MSKQVEKTAKSAKAKRAKSTVSKQEFLAGHIYAFQNGLCARESAERLGLLDENGKYGKYTSRVQAANRDLADESNTSSLKKLPKLVSGKRGKTSPQETADFVSGLLSELEGQE